MRRLIPKDQGLRIIVYNTKTDVRHINRLTEVEISLFNCRVEVTELCVAASDVEHDVIL